MWIGKREKKRQVMWKLPWYETGEVINVFTVDSYKIGDPLTGVKRS